MFLSLCRRRGTRSTVSRPIRTHGPSHEQGSLQNTVLKILKAYGSGYSAPWFLNSRTAVTRKWSFCNDKN
ncbi:hypothetical protein TMatcc_009413 [Talaromyces marneffei ATCC 18224]